MAPGFGPRARDATVALAVGAAHATWLIAAAPQVRLRGLGLAWAAVGLTLVATIPAALLLRRLLVAPLSLVVWLSVTVAVAQARPTPHGPFGLYAAAWPAVLLAALVVGAVEYGVRRWSGLAPPKPLVRL